MQEEPHHVAGRRKEGERLMRRRKTRRPWLRKSVDWLKRQLYRPTVTVVLPLAVSLSVRGGMALARVSFPGGTAGNIGFIVVLWLVGFMFVRANSVMAVSTMIPQLVRLDGLAKPPGREVIIRFLRGDLDQLYQSLKGVLDPQGTDMGKSDLDYFTTSCFREGRGVYCGVESVLPSRYYDVYPDYLEEHKRNREKRPDSRSYRILLATRAHLRRDWLRDKRRFEEFCRWHRDNNVQLLHVAPRAAKKEAEELDLRTTDIGLWESQYALLFTPLDGGDVRLSMATQGSGMFESCCKYLEELRASATAVECPPVLVDPDLASRWEEYVFPDRRVKRLKPFLVHVLKSKRESKILDAAVGIGCETVMLRNDRWKVRGNEFEESFRNVARKYAANHGIAKLDLDKSDWTQLSRLYGEEAFGAVLVLGNSICLLPTLGAVKRSLEEFHRVLEPGGLLVIDERNFSRIIEKEAELAASPAAGHSKHRVMYCGTTVRGCPIDIDTTEKRVIWACYENGTEGADSSSLQKKTIGEFELYAFDEGELARTLEDCGFTEVTPYSDLDTTPGRKEDAVFITYVATKPEDPTEKSPRPLLRDDGSSTDEWEALGEGEVVLASECPGSNGPCLQKVGSGDPNGGFRKLEEPAIRPLTLTAWILHPSTRGGGPADRVALESEAGDGYGFCLTQRGTALWIERRDEQKPLALAKKSVQLLEDTWYRYVLRMGAGGCVELRVFDEGGHEVEQILGTVDSTHTTFDRVTIRGGAEYYARGIEASRG